MTGMRQMLSHEAMGTTFSVTVCDVESAYARQGVAEAFRELDRIESLLSRFADGSDVWRLNRLAGGETARVSRETIECLRLAQEVHGRTGGAFDVGWASDPQEAGAAHFELDDAAGSVRSLCAALRIDLGGIGKGFALDRMGEVLRDWDLHGALLAASASTLLALGPPADADGWVLELGGEAWPLKRLLSEGAISASGRGEQGDHIIDPRTGRPATRWWRCWAQAPSAGLADALSTAFMNMSDEQIRGYCSGHEEVCAWAQVSEGSKIYEFIR